MQDQSIYILGIDISRKHFDAALLRPSGRRKNKKFPNTSQGFEQLANWLAAHHVESMHACLEATNTYGHPLAEFLYDRGFQVSLVNPARISGFARGELLRTKTDKQDAPLIARFCQAMSPPCGSRIHVRFGNSKPSCGVWMGSLRCVNRRSIDWMWLMRWSGLI